MHVYMLNISIKYGYLTSIWNIKIKVRLTIKQKYIVCAAKQIFDYNCLFIMCYVSTWIVQDWRAWRIFYFCVR